MTYCLVFNFSLPESNDDDLHEDLFDNCTHDIPDDDVHEDLFDNAHVPSLFIHTMDGIGFAFGKNENNKHQEKKNVENHCEQFSNVHI